MGSILTDADINTLHDRCDGLDNDCKVVWSYVTRSRPLFGHRGSERATLGPTRTIAPSGPRRGWWLQLNGTNELFRGDRGYP